MYIDAHVHCRDFEESNKETIAHALRVAEDSGLSAIFDMPNTKPLTINLHNIQERFRLAYSCKSPVFYGLYIGLTSEEKQIIQAVELNKIYFPRGKENFGTIGLKMFAGKSVGTLGILDEDKQRFVYKTLCQRGHDKVMVVHCEKESFLKPEQWDQYNPKTHNLARPERAEIESILDQIKFSEEEKYKGHLHIAHITIPELAQEIWRLKKRGKRISCGVTPHHLLFDYNRMNNLDGMLYKVNPPLRSKESREKLFECFLAGEIDILETDHAPHTLEDKTKNFMSGIPSLASWPDFTKQLIQRGASQQLIDKMAFENVNSIFGTNIPRLNLPIKRGMHTKNYAFNAYEE